MAAADFPHTRSRSAAQSRGAALPVAAAGRAGFMAALLMLIAQLVWRLYWSHGGVIPSFPELVVAAISRLTPLNVFGAATENLGSLAKQSLFVGVLVGTVAVGYAAGVVAGRVSRSFGRGLGARLLTGLAVAGALFVFTMLVIAPIGHFGLFAADSSYTGGIIVRLVVTFAIFAVAWALLTTPPPAAAAVAADAGGTEVSRRAVIQQAAWGGLELAALAAVGGLTWRLFTPHSATTTTAVTTTSHAPSEDSVVQEIVAKQRAAQGYPTPVPQEPSGEIGVRADASLLSDTASADTAALFGQLDKAGRITPILTATKDFYHVSKNISDPVVSPKGWKLTLTGLVEKEMTFTYDDLVQRATTKNITTLCCISNPINGDLISTAQWTGIPLVNLLKEAVVKPNAVDIMYHSADDYEDSIPVAKGLRDPSVMLVVGMNDAPLPSDHGGPARLIVPNIYGMKNAKWLERIELVGKPFYGYWETQGWSYTAICQIWGRIDYPEDGGTIQAGPAIADGIATAGDRGIKRVEVSLDGGDTWADATLEPSLNPPFTWVRWAFPFTAKPGNHALVMRATDGTGKVMDGTDRDPLPDGATGWPSSSFNVKG